LRPPPLIPDDAVVGDDVVLSVPVEIGGDDMERAIPRFRRAYLFPGDA
jgi:serine acetyltransferase